MTMLHSEPDNPVITAAHASIALLAQGAVLIRELGPERYDVKVLECFNSTAGGHFRHVIEHFQALLDYRRTDGSVSYEGRPRDTQIETDAERARSALTAIEAILREHIDQRLPDAELLIASETAPGRHFRSSLSRELEFLLSHTVHHYALLKVIAAHHDVETPTDFGMAPSTLKHRQREAEACAH